MEKLKLECPRNFRRISLQEFSVRDDFNEECSFSIPLGYDVCTRRTKITVWHQKTFNKLKSDLNLNLSSEKALMFYHFFINTIVDNCNYKPRKTIEVHMVGLFFVLIELDKFFEKFIKPFLPPGKGNNKILQKRYYLDIKRRIFNIFYYFAVGPNTLNFGVNSLLSFLQKNKNKIDFILTPSELEKEVHLILRCSKLNEESDLNLMPFALKTLFKKTCSKNKILLNLTPAELKTLFKDCSEKQSQLILEFNAQFHYMWEKNSAVFHREDPRETVKDELSSEYKENVQKKNKFKWNSLLLRLYPRPMRKPITKRNRAIIIERLKQKTEKEVKKNMFEEYKTWL